MAKGFATRALDAIFNLCYNHAKKVMSFWIILALIGAYCMLSMFTKLYTHTLAHTCTIKHKKGALDLPNYCIFEYLPPPGSPSDEAYTLVQSLFPSFTFQDYEIIVIQSKNGQNIINNNTQHLLSQINDSLWHEINHDYNILESFSTYFDYSDQIPSNAPIYPLYKERFVNTANDTMICFISLDINNIAQDVINGFVDELMDKLSSLHSTEYSMLSLTGALTMWNQGMKEMQNDMTTKDMLMMPLIFALMMYMVGSWRFIFIVGPTLGMAIVISMSSFVPFAYFNVFALNPMVPSIMLFLCMALSVDYSMFLLSRFTTEIRKGTAVPDAVREMIRYSAHVVILSGMVLIISWFGVAFIPFSGMNTLGLGSIFAIFFCVTINITFTASSICAFPKFFSNLEILPRFVMVYCCCCCEQKTENHHGMLSTNLKVAGSKIDGSLVSINSTTQNLNVITPKQQQQNVLTSGGGQRNKVKKKLSINYAPPVESIVSHPSHMSMYQRDHKDHENSQNWYFTLTQYTTKWPFNVCVPLLIYAAMSPAIYILFTQYQYSMDFTAYFPNDSSSVIAYKTMMDSFPAGDLWPYYILGIAQNKNEETIWTDDFFSTFCYSTQQIMSKYPIPSYHFHSVMYAPNITNLQNATVSDLNISKDEIFCFDQEYDYQNETFSMVDGIKLFYENGSEYINPNDPFYEYYYYVDQYMSSMISDSETASIISFIPSFNPLLQSAVQPSRDIRSLMDSINANKSIANTTKFYVHNSLYWQIDSLDETYDRMPYIMGIIIVAVFVLIAVMFKAYLLPLRLIFLVIIPIAFVYGCAVGIYVLGWMDWLGWNALHSGDGIVWMLPCITVTILMGLAMDYEIFLFSRIFEYRYKGYNSRAAIILAVANTGPIISSAGTVMILAFFGMLLQNIVCSNQMGFLFVFGVLIDTFIIRPLLVPSLSSLVDWLNWWPNLTTDKHLMDEYGHYE